MKTDIKQILSNNIARKKQNNFYGLKSRNPYIRPLLAYVDLQRYKVEHPKQYAWYLGKRIALRALFNGANTKWTPWSSPFVHKQFLNPLSELSNSILSINSTFKTFSEVQKGFKSLYVDGSAIANAVIANNTPYATTYYAPFRAFVRNRHRRTTLEQYVAEANASYPKLDSRHTLSISLKPNVKDMTKDERLVYINKLDIKGWDYTTDQSMKDAIRDKTLSKYKNDNSKIITNVMSVTSKINMIDISTDSELKESGYNDLVDTIPFKIKIINNNKNLVFAAAIESYTDSNSSSWTDKQAVGKAVPLKSYEGNGRTMNLSLKIFPTSSDEMKIMYRKLNQFIGLQYPFYNSEGFPESPIVKLTLGNLFMDTYCIITNSVVNFDMEQPMENQSKFGQLPKSASLNIDIFPIGNELQHAEGRLIHGLPKEWLN